MHKLKVSLEKSLCDATLKWCYIQTDYLHMMVVWRRCARFCCSSDVLIMGSQVDFKLRFLFLNTSRFSTKIFVSELQGSKFLGPPFRQNVLEEESDIIAIYVPMNAKLLPYWSSTWESTLEKDLFHVACVATRLLKKVPWKDTSEQLTMSFELACALDWARQFSSQKIVWLRQMAIII